METFSALLAMDSLHKGRWRGALMFSSNCFWINGWVNYDEAGDLRRHRAHYDVTKMFCVVIACMVKHEKELVPAVFRICVPDISELYTSKQINFYEYIQQR